MGDWWADRLAGKEPQSREVRDTPNPPPINFPTAQTNPQPVTQPSPQERYINQQQQNQQHHPDPNGQVTMGDAIRTWQGGEAWKKDGHLVCPSCGSNNYFSRTSRTGGSMINGASPAPRCYECGYNGLYEQADQSAWVAP